MVLLKSELELFPQHTLIERFDASHFERLFIVGDLHGCYLELTRELENIDFDFKKDLIISVGDLVDRGKDSLKCLELVKEPWFKAIRGNHEQMCLEADLAPEMRKNHCEYGGEWLYLLPADKQYDCLNLCLNLPIILEVYFKDKIYGFVHADINMNDWSMFKIAIQAIDYFTDQETSALHCALWGNSRISNGLNRKKYQSVVGVDEVYLGHTVVSKPTQIQNCFYIDTGIVFGNNLTIKELSY